MSLASSQILSVPLPTVLEKSLGKLWEAIFSSAGQWTPPPAPKNLSKTEQLRFPSLGKTRNVGLGVGGGLSSSNPPPNFPHPTSPPGGMCSGPKRAANSVSCCYSPQPHKDYIYKIWDLFFLHHVLEAKFLSTSTSFTDVTLAGILSEGYILLQYHISKLCINEKGTMFTIIQTYGKKQVKY